MDDRLPSILLAASFTCFIYDYILNLADEVEFIWKQHRNWMTFTYLLIKFITLASLICGLVATRSANLPGTSCVHFAILIGASLFIVSGYADILLTFRLYYMYNRNRRLLIVSLALYAAIDVTSVIVSYLNFPTPSDYTFEPKIGSCFIRLVWALPTAWLLGLGYHVYLAVLALAKVRQAYAHRQVLGVKLSLLALLVQGNLQYYLIMIAVYTVMTVLTFVGPGELGSYNLFTMTSMGIFGPKLLRDMRRILVPGGQDDTFSTILFASQQTTLIRPQTAEEEIDRWTDMLPPNRCARV